MMTITTMITMATTTMTTMMTKCKTKGEPTRWEWQEHAFRAMNTNVHLTLVSPKDPSLLSFVEDSFGYFERLLSRFRDDSELSRLNESRQSPFQASHDLFAAVEAAIWAAQQTGGIYDPTILHWLEKAGYDRTFEEVVERQLVADSAGPVGSARPNSLGIGRPDPCDDYRSISLNSTRSAISRPAGIRLDLGGMGKGWTVDRVADELSGTGHFILNAGGDLYAYGTAMSAQGWEVDLGHPELTGRSFATLVVDHHAVATSTIARRRWTRNGATHHHLIDPRTGCSADTDVLSVSVVGTRVFTAEIYAKVALILGIEDGLAYLEQIPDVEAAIYSSSGDVYLTTNMDRYVVRLDPQGY